MNVTVKDLFEAGVHFGHQLRRWNPKSKAYVYTHRNKMSIIDLDKTHTLLEKAANYVEELVASGEDIMLVGTKKKAQEIIREAGVTCTMPFAANRWIGGTFTNFATVKTGLKKYNDYLAKEKSGELSKLPGKEAAAVRRDMSRINRNFEGLLKMERCPKALFVVDTQNEQIAVAEANRMNIPIVALVDTNSDPSLVQYPIPGNDDSAKSIRIIVEVITGAIQKGLELRMASQSGSDVVPIIRQQLIEDQVEVEVTLPEGFDMEDDDDNLSQKSEKPAP